MDIRIDAAREGQCQMTTMLRVWRILNRLPQIPRRSG